jgi:hypothetical protein
VPHELHNATQDVTEPASTPAGEPPDRRRLARETAPEPAVPPAPVSDRPQHSLRRPEVVEFDAAQTRDPRLEPPATPDRADVALPTAAIVRHTEPTVEQVRTDRVWERAVRAPAPSRESDGEGLPEPASPGPLSRLEPSEELAPTTRTRAEPSFAVDVHPWPELPPPFDEPESEVEAAMRAWRHQDRIDHEQTRL